MNPKDDGVTHINVFSRGRTWLGRQLSNFARTPFIHPDYGAFHSIEGFWYWLGTRDPRLKKLSGYKAKALGSKLPKTHDVPNFRDEIKRAIHLKMEAYPEILQELVASDLPLKHYYVFNGKVVPAGYDWLLEILEDLRRS